MNCERCGATPTSYELLDYCATCSKNLCADCMKAGCCGAVPAASGAGHDHDEETENT